MRDIDIAVASGRKVKRWTNEIWHWKSLVEKCEKSIQTGETLEEYATMDKESQSDVKDVGGFVGGYLENGCRKKGCVVKRDVVSLDLDNAKSNAWELFTQAFPSTAGFMYSTHTHTPKNPRLRLVVLLSESITEDAYEPVARHIASKVGIEMFDRTTYEASRLMYWPSHPKDVMPWFAKQEGEGLNPYAILEEYENWHDPSQWPYAKGEEKKTREQVFTTASVEDPRLKIGIVGSFCRVFSVKEAITEFLSHIYEPSANNPRRYNYIPGHVANGLIVDGKDLVYSFNATDPISKSGNSFNAFDLVRIHMYGQLDKGHEGEKKLPSYKAMKNFALGFPAVKEDYETFRPSGDNIEGLEFKKDGKSLQCSVTNIRLILSEHPAIKGKIWVDSFLRDIMCRDLPWEKGSNKAPRPFANTDFSQLAAWLDKNYKIYNNSKMMDAITSVASDNESSIAKDYLNSLQWDGVERLDTLLIDYLGAKDTELFRMQTRKHLVAAVTRVMNPGAKYDYVLVILGKEGVGKSTLVNKLGGKWFREMSGSLEGKDAMDCLRGAWVIELSELSSTKRSDVEFLKAFITREVDTYRPAYARVKDEFPRQCVFFGTSNDYDGMLKSQTGDRRFWIIEAGANAPTKSVFRMTQEDIDQIWAEAVVRYKEGEELFLTPELSEQAKAIQDANNENIHDSRTGLIEEYLDTLIPSCWDTWSVERRKAFYSDTTHEVVTGDVRRDQVSTIEIFCELFKGSIKDFTSIKGREISRLMRNIDDWERQDKPIYVRGYGKQRVYIRKEAKVDRL